jgi:hypothetical protein
MAIFGFGSSSESDCDEMARIRPINAKLVTSYVDSLVSTRTDRAGFERVLSDLKSNPELRAAEVIAIAHKYVGGGKKPSSKTMALAAISKRFVEIVRFHAKNKVAEKARPW